MCVLVGPLRVLLLGVLFGFTGGETIRALAALTAGDEVGREVDISEGSGEAWLQRKISVLAPTAGGSIGDVAQLITRSFKEVEQYRLGLVNLQVQSAGYQLSQGITSPRTTTLSLPLSQGQIVLGDGGNAVAVFLHSEEGTAEEGRVCEILVTLQGDRGLRGAHPATHVVGEPREGDDMSEVRRCA